MQFQPTVVVVNVLLVKQVKEIQHKHTSYVQAQCSQPDFKIKQKLNLKSPTQKNQSRVNGMLFFSQKIVKIYKLSVHLFKHLSALI